jgi:hypothetical protein
MSSSDLTAEIWAVHVIHGMPAQWGPPIRPGARSGTTIAMMAGGSVEMRYSAKELIPRLIVGFVASNFAVALWAVLIEVANALTVSMVGTAAPTTEAVAMTRTRVAAALPDPHTALVALTLVASWLVRVGVLVILAAIAPVAFACYATPWTAGAAQPWWRSLLGCLAAPTLQAVAFSTGIQLMIDPDGNLPVLIGLPGSDIVNLLLIAVLLWVTIKIPGLMRRYVIRQGGPNMGGVLLRAVLIQSVTRRIPLRRAVRGGR